MSTKGIPVTECWRKSYEHFAGKAGLDSFPTRAYLKANPEKSLLFRSWVVYMLGLREGRVCNASDQACRDCQDRGLSKWTAMYVLAHIVRDEDAYLFGILQQKCREFKKARNPHHPDDTPPGDTPGPKGPLAGRMPVPQPLVYTDAVAREIKEKPWVKRFI